jgi:glycerate dehydrogenase
MKIVVLDRLPLDQDDLNWQGLEALGQLKYFDRTEPEDVFERLEGATIACSNKVILDKKILENCPDLKFIQVMATGANIIDFDESKKRGIKVANVPSYSTSSVAQHTMALLLHLVRDVAGQAASVRQGDWSSSPTFSYFLKPFKDLEDLHLGIVGEGEIGLKVATLARAFGMKVSFASLPGRPQKEHKKLLDVLLPELDVLSLHCPLSELSEGLINEKRLALMKSDAWLINTSRGKLINEKDLAQALEAGHLAGVGLDVLSQEPPAQDNPLLSAPRCCITPHAAWGSLSARQRLVSIMVENIKAFQNGEDKNIL